MRINIKPLSVNEAWRGRKFKTDKYKHYERDLLLLLPKIKIHDGNIKISIIYGFSSKGSDVDNPTKCFIDVLQKKYCFNDSRVYEIILKKEIVSKGNEFIEFNISYL